MIRTHVTDGGKVEEGFTHEHNDCGVRALALAADIPYSHAHRILKQEGRKNRKGTSTGMIERAVPQLGLVVERIISGRTYSGLSYGPLPTVADTIHRYPKGRFIIITNDHGMALIDGEIHDTGVVKGPRARVKMLFRITRPVPVAPEITQDQINELWERLDRLEARS